MQKFVYTQNGLYEARVIYATAEERLIDALRMCWDSVVFSTANRTAFQFMNIVSRESIQTAQNAMTSNQVTRDGVTVGVLRGRANQLQYIVMHENVYQAMRIALRIYVLHCLAQNLDIAQTHSHVLHAFADALFYDDEGDWQKIDISIGASLRIDSVASNYSNINALISETMQWDGTLPSEPLPGAPTPASRNRPTSTPPQQPSPLPPISFTTDPVVAKILAEINPLPKFPKLPFRIIYGVSNA